MGLPWWADDDLHRGAQGWINGVQYQAVSFIVSGTFTPTGDAGAVR